MSTCLAPYRSSALSALHDLSLSTLHLAHASSTCLDHVLAGSARAGSAHPVPTSLASTPTSLLTPCRLASSGTTSCRVDKPTQPRTPLSPERVPRRLAVVVPRQDIPAPTSHQPVPCFPRPHDPPCRCPDRSAQDSGSRACPAFSTRRANIRPWPVTARAAPHRLAQHDSCRFRPYRRPMSGQFRAAIAFNSASARVWPSPRPTCQVRPTTYPCDWPSLPLLPPNRLIKAARANPSQVRPRRLAHHPLQSAPTSPFSSRHVSLRARPCRADSSGQRRV
jgi:hypothetical protein